MERLTIDEIIEHCERKTKLYEEIGKSIDFETTELTDAIKEYWEHKQVKEYLEELKRYRDLDEQGLLLRLPVKAGDTVYRIENGKITQTKITKYDIYADGSIWFSFSTSLSLPISKFKTCIFLTQAEAEQKLKEMEGD